MINIFIKNLLQNKKTTMFFLISIVITAIFLFLTSFLFSSVYQYILNETIQKQGSYHVKIKTDLKGYEDFINIKKVSWQGDKVLITYNDINEVYNLTNKLCKQTKCEEITYNDLYLSLKGVNKDNNIFATFKTFIIITLIIIIISSFFIIYNIYKIVLISKNKQIGILKSIGMTSKQLKILLVCESLIFSIVGIIIAFILSLVLIFIILHFISNLVNSKINFYLNFKFFLYTLIFLLLLVTFICLLPVFKSNKNILKLLNSDYKYRKNNKAIKNVLAFLAYANYKRSKKHYKSVIISLVVFITLFVTFNIYLNYGLLIFNKYVNIPKYDAKVITENNSQNYKLLNNFARKNASKYKIYESCQMKVKIDNKSYLDKGPNYLNIYIINGNNYFINETHSVVTKNEKIYLENKKYFKSQISLNINNKILYLKEYSKVPFGFEDILNKNNLLIGVNNIKELCKPNLTLFMNSNNPLENKLDKLLDKNIKITYVDVRKGVSFINNIILAIKSFLYIILILVFFIGISSIISSVILSTVYRRKEFGLLKSLGLTTKQFNELIILESMYITCKAFLYALPIVLFINIFTNIILNEVIDLKLVINWKAFLGCLLVSIIVVRVIMQLCYKKMSQDEVLKLIDSDNI